jgi:hypothetical protein
MLVDLQTQYWKNCYSTKITPQVWCNFVQNSNDILHRNWKINPKVHMEAQKILNNQDNTEQKEQHWKYHITWL